jgi:hypothetical protein
MFCKWTGQCSGCWSRPKKTGCITRPAQADAASILQIVKILLEIEVDGGEFSVDVVLAIGKVESILGQSKLS